MTTIYLDNNATTRIAPEVAEAMWPWIAERYGNPSSLHRLGEEAAEAIGLARSRIARLIGAQAANEIVFTSGGSESDQTAIAQARFAEPARRRILTTAVEHPAVLEPLARLEAQGFAVERIGVDRRGALRVDELVSRIDERCALVSVMWANNETGVVHDVRSIGERCRERGVPFHVDAVQAAGKLAFSVAELPIDFLSMSAHKLHGPKGVGALYVRRGARFEPWSVGGAQERDRRAGTENVAGIVGFGRAAELALEWLGRNGPSELAELRDRLERSIVAHIADARVAGGELARVAGTLSLVFGDISGEAVVMALDAEGVCASSGSACSSGKQAPSHVLLAMGFTPSEASSSLRLSLSRFSTAAELETAAGTVVRTVRELRSLLGTAHG